MPATATQDEAVVQVTGLCTRFGEHVVHAQLGFEVRRGEIFGLIGGSGSGKSTLLREMILLHHPDAGSIRILGVELAGLDSSAALSLRQRCGVMFQRGGLFASLTVTENVGLPLREHTQLSDALIDAIAASKIALSGLPAEAGRLLPDELSGGMMKRASLARALALDPELLFLDEPTAGLDPMSADGVDVLVRNLRDLYGLTILMITHDLDLLWQVADRVAVLADGRVQAEDTMTALATLANQAIRPFFAGPRGRAASAQAAAVAARPAPEAAGTAGAPPSKPR